jgi:hypothetical protein
MNRFVGVLDMDAFAGCLSQHDPYMPVPTDRITVVP